MKLNTRVVEVNFPRSMNNKKKQSKRLILNNLESIIMVA